MPSNRGGYNIDDQYGTYFVTFTVVGWVDLFTRLECRHIIISGLKYCIENKGLKVHGYVIMSSHLHLVISAAENGKGLSAIIRDFKRNTSKELIKWIEDGAGESRSDWLKIVHSYHAKFNKRNSKYQIWIQDNQPKLCTAPKFTKGKLNYIHNNPVVAEIVNKPEDYKYSSAANYAGLGDCVLEIDIIDFGVEEGYLF